MAQSLDAVDAPPSAPSVDMSRHRSLAIVGLASVALLLIRLYVASATGLTEDEAYYRMWALAPALSYLDHPPMIAWMIAAGRAIAGDTEIGIRLLAPLVHLAGALALWRTVKLLFGADAAQRTVWFYLAMPLLAVGGVIVTPDLPSVLFCGLVLWSLAELDHSKNANWWLAIGVFAGCGLLSKYTNLFIGATILIWLVAVPANRVWLKSPQLWIGALIAAALTSPVVIWNAEHQWASFTKQFGRVGRSSAATGGSHIFEVVGGFIGLASPIIAGLAVFGLALLSRRAFLKRDSSSTLVVAAIAPMLTYFVIHALHDRVQANWLAPLYPPLALCAAIGLAAVTPQARQRLIFFSAIALGFASTAVIYAHALHPIAGLSLRKDPTTQMRGWGEFADAVDRMRRDHGAAWIATSSYATTAQLTWTLKDRSPVAQLNEPLRYAHLPKMPAATEAAPALYVELGRRANVELLRQLYAHVTPLGTVIRQDGAPDGGDGYQIFLVSDRR